MGCPFTGLASNPWCFFCPFPSVQRIDFIDRFMVTPTSIKWMLKINEWTECNLDNTLGCDRDSMTQMHSG